MVWANTATKIYHKEGDPSYGKTGTGKWLTEEEAVNMGYRAAKPNAAKEKEKNQPPQGVLEHGQNKGGRDVGSESV